MDSLNRICLIGRLTKEPELKVLDSETKYTNVVLVTNKKYKDKDGNKIPEYHHITLWNKLAEILCKTAKKGSLIHLEGYNTSEKIETKDGKVFYVSIPVIETYNHLAFSNNVAKNITIEKDENNNEMEK